MKDMERETVGASMTDSERKEMEKGMAKEMARVYSRGGASTTKGEMKRMARKGKR